MHNTTATKKLTKGFTITTKARQGGFDIQTIIMMSARTKRVGDQRRKLRERDDRRMRD